MAIFGILYREAALSVERQQQAQEGGDKGHCSQEGWLGPVPTGFLAGSGQVCPRSGELFHPGPPWPTSNNSAVKNQECRKMPKTVCFPLGQVEEKTAPFLD